jgi:hypothetical protein
LGAARNCFLKKREIFWTLSISLSKCSSKISLYFKNSLKRELRENFDNKEKRFGSQFSPKILSKNSL